MEKTTSRARLQGVVGFSWLAWRLMLTIVSVSAAWRIGVAGHGGDVVIVLVMVALGVVIKKPNSMICVKEGE